MRSNGAFSARDLAAGLVAAFLLVLVGQAIGAWWVGGTERVACVFFSDGIHSCHPAYYEARERNLALIGGLTGLLLGMSVSYRFRRHRERG
jgi:hypothetical protein